MSTGRRWEGCQTSQKRTAALTMVPTISVSSGPGPPVQAVNCRHPQGLLKPQAITVLMPQSGTWRPPTPILLVIYASKQTLGACVSAAGC